MHHVQSTLSRNCLKMAANRRQGPPGSPGGPRDATPSPTYLGASPQPEPTTTLFIYIILQSLCTHFYKFTNSGTMRPLHPAISEVLHLRLSRMHLDCRLHWRPRLMRGQTSWGVANSCDVGIRLQVIEREMFLLFHGCPPI